MSIQKGNINSYDIFDDDSENSDKEQNSEPAEVYRNGNWEKYMIGDLEMGELVEVKVDGTFPADLILIDSDEDGSCFIETGTLDGEKTLKMNNSSHVINFHIKKNKLGRKRKEEINEGVHSKKKKDNMRSKIMTHFSNFVISFLNDYGKKFYPEEKNDFFKKVDYKLRKKVNIDSINKIMQITLREFCELKVSTKNKDCENLNLNSLHLLSNYFEDNFFDIKLYDFYTNFYLSKDIEKLERYYGITKKTKNFECLLEKNKNEIEYKNALKETGYTLIEFANQKSENKIFIFNQNFNDLKERKEFEFMKYGCHLDECQDNLITNQFSEEAISNFNPLINSDSPLINLHENEKINSLDGDDENTLKDFLFYNNNETLFNPE